MFDWEYEEYLERSDLEELTTEYTEKVKGLLTERARKEIGDIENREKVVSEKETELKEREREIERKENELEKQKDQIIIDWIKKYGLDLEIGQKVWEITNNYNKERCPICKGTRKVKALFGDKNIEIDCPECKGYGEIREITKEIVERYVTGIDLRCRIREEGYKKTKLYMIKSDSIPWEVTSVWIAENKNGYHEYCTSAENIFTTQEEAKKKLKEIEDK